MSEGSVKPRGSLWLTSPAIDLVIGCGAWSLPLMLLSYATPTALQGWTVAFYTVALIVNYPHYMATIYRAYHTREDVLRYRAVTIYITGLLLVVLAAAHWLYALVPWLFTIYFMWSPWHYMGQNFGLAMMFIGRSGVTLDRKYRNGLWAAFVASYLMFLFSFQTRRSLNPYVLSVELPPSLEALRTPLMFFFAAAGIFSLAQLIRQAGWRPMIAPSTLLLTQFLWSVLPTAFEFVTGAPAPQFFSASILALMHCTQYLWITSYYARREPRSVESGQWRASKYFAILVIGGAALFIPGPWVASYALGRDFSLSVLLFTAVINIHHFILDGRVWKLREPRVRSLLTSTGQNPEPASTTPWGFGPGRPWRLAGTVAVALLLIITGVDQVRYYLTKPEGNNAGLVMAATLNPYDSSVQTQLGRFYASSGDKTRTESSYRQSIRVNPHDTEAQNGVARILIEEGRLGEAYAHYQQMFANMEPDAEALMNFGAICKEFNRHDEALTSFQRVLEKRPDYAPAHLLLAEILDADRKTPEAILHYQKYVDLQADPKLQTFALSRLQELRKK